MQIKTHTSTSARNKNTHNLRNSPDYKNVNIQILEKNDIAFKKEKEIISKDILKQEELRKYELKKINSSIATYRKRIEKATDEKQIERLQRKLDEYLEKREALKNGKSLEIKETRGKKKEKDFIEFEFALTNSNHLKENQEVRKALFEATEDTQKNFKFFKELQVVSNVMHLDQFSLHTHLLCKVPKNKTIDNLFKSEILEKGLENTRKLYKSIQTFFNETLRDKLRELNLDLQEHTTGKKYFGLNQYKKNQELEKIQEQERKRKILEEIDNKRNQFLNMISIENKEEPKIEESIKKEKPKAYANFGANTTTEKKPFKPKEKKQETITVTKRVFRNGRFVTITETKSQGIEK